MYFVIKWAGDPFCACSLVCSVWAFMRIIFILYSSTKLGITCALASNYATLNKQHSLLYAVLCVLTNYVLLYMDHSFYLHYIMQASKKIN